MSIDISFLFTKSVYRLIFLVYICFILVHACLIIYSFSSINLRGKEYDERLSMIEGYLESKSGVVLYEQDSLDEIPDMDETLTTLDYDSLIVTMDGYKEQIQLQQDYIDKLKAKIIKQDTCKIRKK